MKARYQYRIYPTNQQAKELSKVFGCCRVVWNDALAFILSRPEDEKWPNSQELEKLCITLAKQYPEREWLAEVSCIPLQQSVQDLGTALKNFFESCSGKRKGPKIRFPRFKKKDGKQSARFRVGGFSIQKNKLVLARLGALKVKWSRELPSQPSSVTILKNKAGQYHASFVVEVEQKDIEPIRKSVGVDLGIKTFAFLSTGERIESPGYKRLSRKIARTNRQLARRVKGSNRWKATKLKLAKLHLKLANIRKNFLHKASSKLIRQNHTVSLENLNVSGMLKNRRLSRAISQQGWRTLRTMCEAKALQYRDRVVSIISRWEPTSQICSDCGFKWGKLDLKIRSILCLSCGTEHDRDENASKNIDASGLELAHDVKQKVNACKPGLSRSAIALSSQPYEANQLTLSF